jgi:hypothetical protein
MADYSPLVSKVKKPEPNKAASLIGFKNIIEYQ